MLTVIVDNETARENVSRYAKTAGFQISMDEKDNGTYIYIHKKEANLPQALPEIDNDISCEGEQAREQTVYLVTSSTLGQGSEELGKILMRSFIFSLKESEVLPAKMMFLNSGVFLTTEGSSVLDELKQLVEMGTEIFSCGTCLDYYQLKDKLQVAM